MPQKLYSKLANYNNFFLNHSSSRRWALHAVRDVEDGGWGMLGGGCGVWGWGMLGEGCWGGGGT